MIPTAYPDRATMARLSARMLLDIGAVHFNTDQLYTHASGKQAPTYIDCPQDHLLPARARHADGFPVLQP